MINRRAFVGLLASAASFFGFKSKNVEARHIEVKPVIVESMADSYAKFVRTDYLKRMDFSQMGYDVSVANVEDKFDYINRQVLAFREQEPIRITGKKLKPMRDCWREAVAEVNARYGIEG